jgi:tetratricopeptide (TPR) repeat protein
MKQMKRGHYKEDEFHTLVNRGIKYIVRHKETSIIVGLVVLVGIAALVFFFSGGEKQNPEADLLHTQAMSLITMGRFQEAEQTLLDLTSRFGNTRPGKIGYYYLGTIYYHTGRFNESLEYFKKFIASAKNDYLLTPAATFGAGCAAEGLKDYETALQYYKKVAENEKSPFYQVAMLSYGRVTGLLGDKEKAREILKDLIEKNPPPDVTADATFYIGYFNE